MADPLLPTDGPPPEAILNQFFQQAPCGMIHLRAENDGGFRVEALNPMARRMLRPRSTAPRPLLTEALPGLADPLLLESLNQARDRQEPLQRTLVASLDDGAVLWLHCTLTPQPPDSVLLLLEDLSQLRRTESALRESEERFHSLTNSSTDAMVAIDATGNVILWNLGARELFGYEEAEILGRPVLRLIPERLRPSHQAGFTRFRETGIPRITTRTIELHALHKSHREIPVEAAFTHWRGEAGLFSMAIMRDISQRQKMENDLRHMQKMEAIGTMAGGIAHDFNNILGVVIGYAEIVHDALMRGDTPAAPHVQEILTAGLRARDLVSQLLIFSRQGNNVPRPVMLAPILKEGIRFLRTTLPSTTPLHTDIRCQGGPVLADATQMYQLLLNLCSNAEHAMRGREGVLLIELHEVEAHTLPPGLTPTQGVERYIRLSVVDNGSGIPTAIRDRIFDPFFTTKDVGEGTGLGLSVVHGIVTRHNALIHVESRENQGTSVHVFLPRISAAPPQASALHVSASPSSLLMGKKILLVEDDVPMLETTRRLLERTGCTVSAHVSSQNAWEAFRSDPGSFDAVITDYAMPGMTGINLGRKLRELHPRLPILLCTGYAAATLGTDLKNQGFFAVLQKPVLFRDLCDALEQAMGDASFTPPT